MKRIAVVSDIHGNMLALEKVVSDIDQRGIDLVVNLGDHVSGPLWPKETIDFLKRQAWIQVSGNHDRQLATQKQDEHALSDLYARQYLRVKDLDWLSGLPVRAQINDQITAFHGSPANDNLYLVETIENGRARLATQTEINERIGEARSPIMLCGHSHIPRIVRISEGQLIINPGSVGLPAYDDDEPETHIMETGSPHARYAVLEGRADQWAVELIAVSYDYQQAANQARKNGRRDWEIGLRTGYMQLK